MLVQYQFIDNKYKNDISYNQSLAKKYINEKLICKQIFNYDNWPWGRAGSTFMLTTDIFTYIPFTKKNINKLINELDSKYPFLTFYTNTVFSCNQPQALKYLENFLSNNKNIPCIYAIDAINITINEKAKKQLIYNDIDKFFVPVEIYATPQNVLHILQFINQYYKQYNNQWTISECYNIVEIIYDFTLFLIDSKLINDKINYELLKIKKLIFLQCIKNPVYKSFAFYYDRFKIKQIIKDLFYIFHKKKNQYILYKIIDWLNGYLCAYNEQEKKDINYILKNIQFISYKHLLHYIL